MVKAKETMDDFWANGVSTTTTVSTPPPKKQWWDSTKVGVMIVMGMVTLAVVMILLASLGVFGKHKPGPAVSACKSVWPGTISAAQTSCSNLSSMNLISNSMTCQHAALPKVCGDVK